MEETSRHDAQHVAGVGMMFYPETPFALSMGSQTLYSGTRAGFAQWAITVLAGSTLSPQVRLAVETALYNGKLSWLAAPHSP